MNTFNNRGTTINKINLSDFQENLEEMGLNEMQVWLAIGNGEDDHVYVSNGFLNLLSNPSDMTDGEWHHYFVKDTDGEFTAEKFKFNNKVSTYMSF